MRKVYKLSRRSIDSFNHAMIRYSKNSTGFTMKELLTMFNGKDFRKDIPMIVALYIQLKAARLTGDKIFIYWNKDSSHVRNRAWNGFVLKENTWVCELSDLSGVMFEKPIYLRAKNYLDTFVDFEYDSEASLGKYIDKLKEKKGIVDEPEVKSRALF